MSSIEELEREAAQLSQIVHEPTPQERALQRLHEIRDQITAAQEARTAAERWLLDNVRAIGGINAELEQRLTALRQNPNARDVKKANEMWDKMCARLAWAFVVERRLPGVKVPNATAPVAPGQRLGVEGLSASGFRRPIHPVIVAWWDAATRERAWESAAAEWFAANAASLPEDLRAILAAAPPVSFEPPADPVRGNETLGLARVPVKLAQAAR
jgi:hypothetical protein